MKAARRRGKHVGRPLILTPKKNGKGRAVAARMVGVNPATLRRALNAKG